LLVRNDVNTADLMESLASIGESGRMVAWKVWEAAGMSRDEADALFDIALLNGRLHYVKPDLKYFFKIAKAAGVETRLIKTARSEAAEGAEGIDAHDWIISWPDGLEDTKDFDEFKYRE